MQDWLIITLSVIGGVIVLLILLCFIIGAYFCRFTFKSVPFVINESVVGPLTVIQEKDYQDKSRYERIQIESKDGHKLVGFFYPSEKPTHRYVILFHGYKSTPLFDFSASFKKFHLHGFNVLGICERGDDESEGKYFSMGNLEADDAHSWVDYLVARDQNAEIALFGRSMGAHTVMLSFRDDYPSNVKCFIEDAGYQNLNRQLISTAKSMKIPFAKLMVFLGVSYLKLFHHIEAKSDVTTSLNRCHVPGLFIHGENDGFVPHSNLKLCYEALSCQDKEMESFPGAEHVSSEGVDEKRFDKLVFGFIEKHMKGQ